MLKKNKIIIGVALLLLVGVFAFLVIKNPFKNELVEKFQNIFVFKPQQGNWIGDLEVVSSGDESGWVVYNYSKYGFTFQCPGELKISTFQEGEYGDMILAQNTQSEEKQGFQVFISPFDEQGPITKERILQDLPNMRIDQSQDVIITKDNIQALIFLSDEESFENTREIWFVYNDYLYQVSTYAGQDGFIGKVLETLDFLNI